ncbi:hypothetical protein HJFPF1_04790 [Paramyrothecium foliicola]|nr:hypothetical protein HJFPF1_04790 [Paramyrothecium foliicola]
MSSKTSRRLALLKESLEALTLDLGTFQPPINAGGLRELERRNTLHSTNHDIIRKYRDGTWRKNLDGDLEELAAIMQQAPKLQFLGIETYGSPKPDPLDGPEDHLPLNPIKTALSVEHLRFLVIDLPGGVLTPSGNGEESCHICPAIAALLHKVQYLRLRMRSICPDVLKPRDSMQSIRLNEVVLNLSLKMGVPGISSAAHSKRCGSLNRGGFLQLKEDMQKQAEALAAKMSSPRLIRILTHTLVHLETQSLDVLTGKRMALEDSMPWDEDGNTVEEDSGTDSEFSDDDSSTSFET